MKPFWNLLTGLLFVSVAIFTSVSCKEDKDDPELNVDKAEINISADGRSTSFQITSNTSWIITGNPNWLTITPTTGTGNKSVSVVASENSETNNRSCELIVKTDDGGISRSIAVTQDATVAKLLVNGTSTATMNFGADGSETQQISITANSFWEITNIPSWIRVSPSNGSGNSTLSITITDENFSDEDRTNNLQISGSGATAQIAITQAAKLAKNLRVQLSNTTIMYDGFAADLSFTSATKGYREAFLTESDVASMTDRDIYNLLMEQSEYEGSIDYTFYPGTVSENTNLVYCVAAYGNENKADGTHKYGPMTIERITTATRTYADVMYMLLSYTSTQWIINTSRRGQYGQKCDEYYIFTYTDTETYDYATNCAYVYLLYTKALFAHLFMKPSIDAGTANYKYEPQTMYYSRSSSETTCFSVTWGINRDTKQLASTTNYAYKSIDTSTGLGDKVTRPTEVDRNNPEVIKSSRRLVQELLEKMKDLQPTNY